MRDGELPVTPAAKVNFDRDTIEPLRERKRALEKQLGVHASQVYCRDERPLYQELYCTQVALDFGISLQNRR